jgi:exportin-1
MAGQILNQFKESQEVWTQVDSILELSNSLNTKFFALQVLEILIKTRWKALPRDQCEGVH